MPSLLSKDDQNPLFLFEFRTHTQHGCVHINPPFTYTVGGRRKSSNSRENVCMCLSAFCFCCSLAQFRKKRGTFVNIKHMLHGKLSQL